MEITSVSIPQKVNIEQKTQTSPIKETGLKKDTFEKSQRPFDIEEAMNTITSLKFSNGRPKFTDPKTSKVLREELTKAPEKFDDLYKIAQNKKIDRKILASIATKKPEEIALYADVVYAKDKEGNQKYTSNQLELICYGHYSTKSLTKYKVLADSPLNYRNILNVIVVREDIDVYKLKEKTNEMAELAGEDYEITFSKDMYNKGDYVIGANKKSSSKNPSKSDSIKIVTDKDFNTYEMEEESHYTSGNGQKYTIKKVNDYRNHTTSKIRYEHQEGYPKPVATHEIRIIKDKNDKVQKTEYLEPSDVKGIFNIKQVYPNGKTEQICSAKVDPKTGITTIKKNMVSPLGTRTEYLFEDDPNGNRISDYKITDKNGNVLLNNSTTFEVVGKNKFISSKNGKSYEIKANKTSVTVKDLQNPERTATFKNDETIKGKQTEVLKVLKKMPGEELLKLGDTIDTIYGIEEVLNSKTIPMDNELYVGNDLFVILHEIGHAVDVKDVDRKDIYNTLNKSVHQNEEFKKVYQKEKEAFNKAYPDAQRYHIDYFINHQSHYNGETGGCKETIAEANALLTTAKTHEKLGIRSQYLQQNFPETIAKVSELLNS